MNNDFVGKVGSVSSYCGPGAEQRRASKLWNGVPGVQIADFRFLKLEIYLKCLEFWSNSSPAI